MRPGYSLMKRAIALTTIFLPLSASAEIADKVASYPSMWGISILASLIIATFSYWKPAFVILAIAVSFFLGASYVDMVLDDHFRRLVVSEMGISYFVSGFCSAGLVLATSAMAVLIRRKRRGTLRTDV